MIANAKGTTFYKVVRTAVLVGLAATVSNIYSDLSSGTMVMGAYQSVVLTLGGIVVELLNGLVKKLTTPSV